MNPSKPSLSNPVPADIKEIKKPEPKAPMSASEAAAYQQAWGHWMMGEYE